ncbi:cache domain-containing sensor histidine kinase [Paenibacillus roseipurpureus]|uniref:Sensor histidine kinase n=1 Tax=Paenibacillus roseopurpureus TaxID=2918901 RepID=A0AA96LKR0_9BACL|nr:sensor histidine kinase [Paenibacillus sp. MBLB1832]WNR42897.1 sensor histidine kinase [Paenibacillus sp. MBLB1832]
MLRKLLWSYALLILIPLAIMSLLLYSNTSRLMEKLVTYSAKQSFDQAYTFLNYKMYNIKETSNIILKNPEIIHLLRTVDREDLVAQVSQLYELRNYLIPLQDGTNITKVRLYVRSGLLYSDENENIFNMELAKQDKWYQTMQEENLNNFWSPPSYLPKDARDQLSYIKNIIDPGSYSNRLGMICFDFSLPDIIRLLAKASSTSNSVTYLQNERRDIVASSNDTLLAKYKVGDAIVQELSKQQDPWARHMDNNQDMLVAVKQLEGTDWRMVTAISFDDLIAGSSYIRNLIFVLLLVIGTLAYFVAYFISKSITGRITRLARKMRSFNSTNVTPLRRSNGTDEIDQLIEDYNTMLHRMDRLVEEKYQAGQALKTAELRTLQAQINPHFLYNTLEMINWLSWKNRGEDVQRIVEGLAKYYRLSLSGGKDIITIEEEIQHVSFYFDIQNMRFDQQLRLVIAVDSELLPLYTLKSILQPLVENAILHGILCKSEKSGTITISGTISAGSVVMSITDDGVGMDVAAGDEGLIGAASPSTKQGYGSRNVHNRIQLHFGDGYGIRYASLPGQGTTVTILFPVIREP